MGKIIKKREIFDQKSSSAGVNVFITFAATSGSSEEESLFLPEEEKSVFLEKDESHLEDSENEEESLAPFYDKFRKGQLS